jgi:prophage regulatory protein
MARSESSVLAACARMSSPPTSTPPKGLRAQLSRRWWCERRLVTANTKLIGLPQLISRLSIRKSAIYAGIKDEVIPPPVKLGCASRWIEDEITELLVLLADERSVRVRKPRSLIRDSGVGMRQQS